MVTKQEDLGRKQIRRPGKNRVKNRIKPDRNIARFYPRRKESVRPIWERVVIVIILVGYFLNVKSENQDWTKKIENQDLPPGNVEKKLLIILGNKG